MTGFIGVGQLRYILTNLGEKMSDDEVDELLKAVDTSSGEINYVGMLSQNSKSQVGKKLMLWWQILSALFLQIKHSEQRRKRGKGGLESGSRCMTEAEIARGAFFVHWEAGVKARRSVWPPVNCGEWIQYQY